MKNILLLILFFFISNLLAKAEPLGKLKKIILKNGITYEVKTDKPYNGKFFEYYEHYESDKLEIRFTDTL